MKVKNLILSAVLAFSSLSASAALPSVPLQNLDGDAVNAATLGTEGKPVIVSFFATWCKPCMRELAAIEQVYDDWQDETGVKLYAVSVDKAQDVTKVKPVVDASSWEYEVLLDPNGDFQRAMGAANVPHVVVVDGNGKIVESHSGYTEGSEDHLFEIIRELVNKK